MLFFLNWFMGYKTYLFFLMVGCLYFAVAPALTHTAASAVKYNPTSLIQQQLFLLKLLSLVVMS